MLVYVSIPLCVSLVYMKKGMVRLPLLLLSIGINIIIIFFIFIFILFCARALECNLVVYLIVYLVSFELSICDTSNPFRNIGGILLGYLPVCHTI